MKRNDLLPSHSLFYIPRTDNMSPTAASGSRHLFKARQSSVPQFSSIDSTDTNFLSVMRLSPNTIAAGKGVLIGLASAFGSAALVGLIFYIIYFFRYTAHGRIILDRIGRPGEYDDEQALLREEAEALENMDEISRQEYLRAKGMLHSYSLSSKAPCDTFLLGSGFHLSPLC